ncbi:MAG: hypothetical protein WC343_10790 [Bacilli bacterium]|jgi:hypothetical protein
MNQNDSNIVENDPKNIASKSKTGVKYQDPELFSADKLISKMGDNMARAEASVNEQPLWTEKTAELEDRKGENV